MKNAVILNKDASTWPRIKKYWKEKGVDTSICAGNKNNANNDTYCYYGVINGSFLNYSLRQVEAANAEIIELPEELKEEKKHPEKSILRLAYEIIGRLKAENLKRAGFNDIEISSYLDVDKELKEIESHLK